MRQHSTRSDRRHATTVRNSTISGLLFTVLLSTVLLPMVGCISTSSDGESPASAAASADFTATARASFWRPQNTGDFRLGTRSILGTAIDLDRSLDFEDQDTFVYSADLRFGRWGIDASFFEIKHDGFQRIDQDVSFRGTTFSAAADVESNFDLNIATAHFRGDLIGAGPVALGPKIGVNYLNGYMDLSTGTLAESKQFDEFFPVVGGFVNCGVDLSESWRAFADLEATGIEGSLSGVTGHYFDGQLRLGMQAHIVQLGVGYRHVDLAVERSRINLDHDLKLSGPMLFIAIALGSPKEPHDSLTHAVDSQ